MQAARRRNSITGPASKKLPGRHLLRSVLAQIQESIGSTIDPAFDPKLGERDFDWTAHLRVETERQKEVVFALCKALMFSKLDPEIQRHIDVIIAQLRHDISPKRYHQALDPDAVERIKEVITSLSKLRRKLKRRGKP